jgi:chromosome segregation ATPase
LSLQQSKVEELKKSLAASEAALEVAEGGKKKSKDLVSSMTFVHEQDTAKIRELEETVATVQRGLGEIRLEATRVQEEMGRELQQLGAECAGLRQRAKGLSDQLDSEREGRAGDVKSLREALQTSEQSVCHLQSELQARESANSINQATIAQLQTTCEQTEQEKARLEGSLEEVLQQNRQLAEEAEKLRSSVRQLETDNAALTGERQSLIESCTEVKSSLAQSSGKVESLTARLETALTELSQTQERFESKHREGQEAKKSRNELEDKYRENEKRCEGAESKVQEVTLSLHAREEEVSRLRTQLEVSESAQTQLQRSVAFLQSTTASQEKKIKVLEGERTNLASAVEQLKASQAMLKEVVYSLESEKAQNEGTKNREIESLTHQLEEKVEAEREHLGKIQQFERKWRESQRTTEELQEALRASLTSLGDKREGEVVRQLVSLESSLVATQHEASEAKTTEEALRKELSKTVEESELASAKCSQLQEELECLREEMAERRETIARLAELNEKVGVLEKSQKERSDKIMAAESQLEATSRELQVVKTENAALLERVGEVAAVSLSLAETTAQLEKVRGGLATEGKLRREAVEEKEQLLGVLRRLEVEKHTVSLAPSPEASSEWQEADREKLLSLTREREEEATRLREYVSKLLSAVVEKAPFLLEKLSD